MAPIIGDKLAYALRTKYHIKKQPRDKMIVEAQIDLFLSRFVKRRLDDTILLPPPGHALCWGDVPIGRLEYLGQGFGEFHLRLRDVNRHVGIFGSTGTGKTTLALQLIRNLHSIGIPVLVIDWETSYRSLAGIGARILRVGLEDDEFQVNIFRVPPGIDHEEYAKSLISIISYDYLGGQGSDTIMMQHILEGYELHSAPHFKDISAIIDKEIGNKLRKGKLAGRRGLWMETVWRIFMMLRIGCIGYVLKSDEPFDIEDLMDGTVVLELGNLKSPHDKAFITHFILNQIMLHHHHSGIVGERLGLVMVLEEMHNIISLMAQRKDQYLNLMDTLFREIRKYGVGLLGIDQTPSAIPNSIYANMNTKISFNQNTSDDTIAMARAMNMQPDQFRFLAMLETGQAIVSVKQRIPYPFLVRVPFA